ncbi:MAG: VWA domain-containing protein [Cocleimonas sp.]|nr:VWA domain-containing protein [Cocleimonas sp.]
MLKNVKKMFFLSCLLFCSPLLYAAEDNVSLIVFDASGSMWAKLKDGRTKIEVAREVISEYLKERDHSTPLGLIAYGHHRKGDCSDIEVIAPVGKQDASRLSKKLNAISPKGKTPLTDSLALAVKQIPKTAEEADIILITDGLETCDKDPCALAKKIAEEGIQIRAHVVGFGLTEKEVNVLSCIPKLTGGHLLRPQSGDELVTALKTVEKKPVKPTPSSKASVFIRLAYAKGTARPTSVAYSAKNVKTQAVIELGTSNDTVEIVRGLRTKLPIGTWLLMAKGPQGKGETEVTIKEGGEYAIPYQAPQPQFSLKNYGPYQLGQEQSFLLTLDKPMQNNLTLMVMLFPANTKNDKDRIDHEYLIGEGKGLREINFKSPATAGHYQIVISTGSLKEQIAQFDIEYVAVAKPSIKIPLEVKPREKFAYELYGNWYRNNGLIISKQGEKISSLWLSRSLGDEGVYLTAPNETGDYTVSLRYKNAKGENTVEKLADFRVGDAKQSENTIETAKTEQTENAKKDDFPYGDFVGNWLLYAKEGVLLKVIVKAGKGDFTGGAYYSIEPEGETIIGGSVHEDEVIFEQKEAQLQLHFGTLKGIYTLTLSEKNTPFFTTVWAGDKPSGKQPIWTGYLENEGNKTPVYLQKMDKKIPLKTASDLYSIEKIKDLELVFTCEQATCRYDDKASGLNGIPLRKDWAIQAPYFYTTAGGSKATFPTLLFVHTKTGLWVALNQRQASSVMFDCIEFGERGRLSATEKLCSPKNIADDILGDSVTLIENIESWRGTFYETASEISKKDKDLKASLFTEGEQVK